MPKSYCSFQTGERKTYTQVRKELRVVLKQLTQSEIRNLILYGIVLEMKERYNISSLDATREVFHMLWAKLNDTQRKKMRIPFITTLIMK